jgi:signal transduction histidine kinase
MQAIETGLPTLDPEMEEGLRAHGAEDLRPLKVLDGLQLRSAMIVPMIARDHVLGALTFIVTASRHRYAPADLEFAQEAAARIALALDNARLHRELQRAIRARDDFFAAATHDLRNPLTAILGAAQTLNRRIQPLSPEDLERVAPMVRLVDSAAHRLSRLVSGLADLARMETGLPLELIRAPIDLTGLAQRVAAESQQTTDMHEIRVEGPEGIVGSWDASRLERAVANLIDNAIKYSPEGGAIDVRVEPTERDGVPHAVLSVQDPGVGIPVIDLPFVFDQFHRGSNVIGQVSGMGLGLAGARQVVEQHGGSISVASELGKGTRMTIELPLAPAAAAEQKGEPISRRA